VELPAKHLPGKTLPAHELTVRHFQKKQKLTFPQLRGDTAIVQYPGDQGSALCAMAMEAQGKRMFVEVDDNYIDYGDELWMKRAGWGDRSATTRTRCRVTAGSSSTRTASSSRRGRSTRSIRSSTTTFTSAATASTRATGRSSRSPTTDLPHRLVREQLSHDRDAVMIRRALSWASRQPNVEIVNIGHDPGWDFARRQVAWTDSFLALRKELMRLDIGVAPLVASPLAKYRSDLKALEYAMAGAMPFLQSSESYWDWEDREFARTCFGTIDWEHGIRWALKNRDEVRARAQQAREYVLAERTFKTEIERWRTAIGGR
jgi:hypothetical protein